MIKQHFLVLFLFLFCLSFALDAQNKYAVLITGDYSAEYIPQRSRWNQCDDEESRRPMQEFWNDTYLMWELLKKKGYSEDNIFVLFADGNDFIFDGQCPRYRPPIGVTVTDNSATIENVTNLFTGFQDGTSGMPILTNDDFLFVWVFDHGDTINGHSNFLLLDGMMNDIQFASLINPLQINRKVFWMQQCFGGGFAESLADNNTVFVSASQANQFAYRADNRTKDGTSIIENEFCIDTLYNHGEFDFHVFSVTNQESPNGDSYYAGVSYSSGDLNDDAYISMKETYVWDTTYNSIDHRSEKAMYNDLGNIGLNTSLEYPTLLYDNINNNETHRGIIGVSKDLYVSNGQTLTFTGKSNITLCNDKLASALSNKCDEIMGNYADAIAWYEGAITNPNTTYCDSVYATIDLGNLYLELQNIGLKGSLNYSLNQFIPKSKELFTTNTDKAIASLPRTNNRDCPYWTDIVIEQPAGYLVLESGDVEISTAEGLAWLISVVNGLNGCEPDDFDGRKITLTTDIDLAYNGEKAFTPIGNRIHRFMGEFDGGRHSIEGLHLFYENTENAATSDLGLFGYVFHGTVRNLWVNSGSSAFVSQDPEQWYQGCIAGISDSLSLIDNCMVMARMSVTNGGGIVGMNRNSTIRNCTYAPPADNTFLVGWNGGGIALRNFSENGYTAEISNCYFYGNMLGSYSVQNEGGIVCFNETSSENGGKSAMVRNCYSELTGELFGNHDNGCIVAHNSEGSVVEYCYADLTKQYNGWGGLLGTDLGDTHNCISFIPDNGDGLLSESVSIGTDETTSLLEVLNYWISLYEIGVFNSWCEGEALPVFCNQSIGINETQPVVDTFVIYPNPTTGQFTVEGANVSKVEVYNLVGQKVCEQQGSKTVSIDAANWNKGIYLVNIIEQDGAVATKKLVVK